jgi:hypothetical protein
LRSGAGENMKTKQRKIPNFRNDLLSLLDASNAMNRPMEHKTRLRVLSFIVDYELGGDYIIVKKGAH